MAKMKHLRISVPRKLYDEARDILGQSMFGLTRTNLRRILVWALRQQIAEAKRHGVTAR
jgi:hypothetical protein